MKTISLFCPLTNSEHLICLDQVVYIYEITDKNNEFYGYIEIRFSDGSTQVYRANYAEVLQSITVHPLISNILNSILWLFRSKKSSTKI